ncbi:MAG: hypothetical protein JNL51_18655 [Chitinophagaceae bacterium]|nr:hypothetical protein [Chitinophagaceae bacterium]
MDKKLKYNPYGNPDGTLKDGQTFKFFKWAREQELERLKALPPEEVKKLEESEEALARRMDF